MYSYLGQHPAVFLPEVKEYRYFGADLDRSGPPNRTSTAT